MVHWAFLLLWRVPRSLPLKNSPHRMMLLPAHFTLGMVLCMWWAELDSFKHDVLNWGSSDQIIFFLRVWGSFRCFSANSNCVFFCLHCGEDWVWLGHTSIKPRSVECCSGVCPSVDFSYLHIWSWSSARVTISFFSTTLKPLSINCSVWPGGRL